MAATVEIDELNGTGTVTHGVSNFNAGAADVPNLVLTPHTAVIAGGNSFLKYNKLHFTNLNGASTISNIKAWVTGTFGTENIITSIGNTSPPSFATPTQVTFAGNFIPTTLPTGANVTISGSLAGTLSAPGTSDIFAWQLQTSGSQHGYISQKTWHLQWDEA